MDEQGEVSGVGGRTLISQMSKDAYSALVRHYFLLTLLFTKMAFAALPLGVSTWAVEASCAGRGSVCRDHVATLTLFVQGNEVCGRISETKSEGYSDAWFSGKFASEGGHVQFVDSFQLSERDFGVAALTLEKNSLRWRIFVAPQGGRIASDLKFRKLPASKTKAIPASKNCSDLEREWSSLSVQLPSPTSYEKLEKYSEKHLVCGDISFFSTPRLLDGPTFYFRESTHELLSACGGACRQPVSATQMEMCRTMCPPPRWVADDCDAIYRAELGRDN